MENLVYAALIAFGAFTTGMAAVAAVFYTKAIFLSRKSPKLLLHAQRHLWLAVTKVGIMMTQAVLLTRLIQTGVADPSLAAWLYTLGLSVTGVGIMGQSATLYKDMPIFEEAARSGEGGS
jgi:hypothetical protein